MKNKEFIGIDVSKKTLDVFILKTQQHFSVNNSPRGFAKLLETCCKQLSCPVKELFFCFENTGRYSRPLAVFLDSSDILFTMSPALEIKQSMGFRRGKNDKMDAKDIAWYAWKNREVIAPTKMHIPEVAQLRQLLTLRDKFIKHRTSYKNSLKDLKDCFVEGETDFIRKAQQRQIDQLNDEIERVEEEIDNIINSMLEWKNNFKLIQSVKGIGPVLARYIIIYTENFTRFTDPRKFACFAGIAPFEYSSGSSIKGKTKVHPIANKHLKSLLNIAAMGAIQLKGEYQMYYQRRTKQGKNKMSTLNIIRNKLVFRVFAVVKRQTPYVDFYQFAA
jgi:transposase